MLNSYFVIIRFMGITCEKIHIYIGNSQEEILGERSMQVDKQNLYKSLVQFSQPLSLYISTIYLFSMRFHLPLTLISRTLLIPLSILYLIYQIVLTNYIHQIIFNWTSFFKLSQFTYLLCLKSLIQQYIIDFFSKSDFLGELKFFIYIEYCYTLFWSMQC